MVEHRINVDIPILPVRGDALRLTDGALTQIGGEYARLEQGTDRFLVVDERGEVCLVEAEAGSTATRRSWRAVRTASRAELNDRGPTPTRSA